MRHLLRSGRRAGSRPRGVVAAVVAVGLAASALPLALSGAANAEVDGGNGTDQPGDPRPAAPALVLAPADPVVLAETEELEFTLVLENPGDQPIDSGRVELRLDDARVDPAQGLDADRTTALEERPLLAEAAIAATPADDEQSVTITVPVTDVPLTAVSAPGVYRVDAAVYPSDEEGEAADADGTADELTPAVTATAPIVWRGPGTDTVPLSTIVPIVLPSDIRTLPTRRQLSDASAQWSRLVAEARAHRATLAIDPRIIAAIRAYGSEVPEAAALVLEELEAYPHDSFLLQFADADPAAQAALGREELLAPESLDFVSRFGEFAEEGTGQPGTDSGAGSGAGAGAEPDPGDAADPERDPETASEAGAGGTGAEAEADGVSADDTDAEAPRAPALPDLAELTSWPAAPAAWPAEGEASTATLSLLRDSGIGTVVLDSRNTTASGGPRATIGGANAIITDAALADAAREAIAGESEADRGSGSARLIAELALAAQGRSPGLVLGLDRGGVGDGGAAADELLARLAELGWVKRTPIPEQATGTATLKSADPLESRTELLRAAVGREHGVVEMGALLEHPEYLAGYQRSRLLELFATRHASPDADFATVAADYRARDAELLRGVQAISTEHTQLVGVSTRVPVQLRNSLPFDATVDVTAVPASAALSVEEREFREVVVPADANERVLVPVRSRVSSGESGLVVSVTAVGGEPTVYTGTLAITISTAIETVGLWVIGVLAALLLGFGIWRSVRRKRRPVAPAAE